MYTNVCAFVSFSDLMLFSFLQLLWTRLSTDVESTFHVVVLVLSLGES